MVQGFLRIDTLSLLLSMANVTAHSDALIMDVVGGLVTGAVAERLGGLFQSLCTLPIDGIFYNSQTAERKNMLVRFRKFRRSVGESKKLSTSSVKAVYSSGLWSPDKTSCQGIWSIRQKSYFAYLFGVKEPGFYGAIVNSLSFCLLDSFGCIGLFANITGDEFHIISEHKFFPSTSMTTTTMEPTHRLRNIAASTLNKNTVLTPPPSKAKTSLTTQAFPKCNNMKTSINNLLTKISRKTIARLITVSSPCSIERRFNDISAPRKLSLSAKFLDSEKSITFFVNLITTLTTGCPNKSSSSSRKGLPKYITGLALFALFILDRGSGLSPPGNVNAAAKVTVAMSVAMTRWRSGKLLTESVAWPFFASKLTCFTYLSTRLSRARIVITANFLEAAARCNGVFPSRSRSFMRPTSFGIWRMLFTMSALSAITAI
ncbi:tRNA (adenine(58)-N(1))-methyltransferase non-catalytic subunit TRM6 [Dillenia turbinata]|uniref:tRNA (adenine(58)-N(1))-methyltransferase non-catalytic subunit TRM6 n=1 Tax=Dillenia turbinata TaxID=194707 RepID=A0AAN8UGY4_9MAGN